jgi:hypothetical protein
MSNTKFQAGKYYIGDLCYVMHEKWTEFCNSTDNEGTLQKLSDNRTFWWHSTAYGDGVFTDQLDKEYPVDAGLIGIIDASSIAAIPENDIELGNVIEFPSDFEVEYIDGTFYIGHVVIDTAECYGADIDYINESPDDYINESPDEDIDWD